MIVAKQTVALQDVCLVDPIAVYKIRLINH